MKKTTAALFVTLALSSIEAGADALSRQYDKAVRDAEVATASEIYSNLVAVTPSNNTLVWNSDKTKVKVVTWMLRPLVKALRP
jgi:hypothetical protein